MGLSSSAKLVKLGTDNSGSGKGNIVFSSLDALQKLRPTQLDDLYSLLCVAYFFIEGSLPWIDFIENGQKEVCQDLGSREEFIRVRSEMKEEFEMKM